MNLSSIVSQAKNLFTSSPVSYFSIYQIDALTATTIEEQDAYTAVTFDSVYAYGYRRDVDIPYQPLEDGDFSTDSILTQPFVLKVTGAITMAYNDDTVADSFESMGDVTADLDDYLNNGIQLMIFKGKPFYDAYYPMHLKDISYSVSPDRITLYADMTFQQVRGTEESAFFYNPNTSLLEEDTNTTTSPRGFVQPKITDAGRALFA